MRSSLLFLSLILFLSACQSGAENRDCATKPEAIFSDDLPGVTSHDFIQTGAEGLEIISFDSGVFLEIFQSGCDSLRQEFRFRLPDVVETDDAGFWLKEAQNQFHTLGALGAEYAPFAQYADALALQEENFRLTQPMEVASGFWMQVDKIESFDGPTLRIVLANYGL